MWNGSESSQRIGLSKNPKSYAFHHACNPLQGSLHHLKKDFFKDFSNSRRLTNDQRPQHPQYQHEYQGQLQKVDLHLNSHNIRWHLSQVA